MSDRLNPRPPIDMTSEVTMNLSQLENIARLAGEQATAIMAGRLPTRDEIIKLSKDAAIEAAEAAAEKGIERFLERCGIDMRDIGGFRKDLAHMKSSREIKEAVISNGIRAVVTTLIGGIITAIYFYLRGGGGIK